ncbi:hypothetical protein EMIT040CA3_40183 [Bacillus pseudomycoides]
MLVTVYLESKEQSHERKDKEKYKKNFPCRNSDGNLIQFQPNYKT